MRRGFIAAIVVTAVALVPASNAGERSARRELVFVSNRATRLTHPAVYSVSANGGRRRALTRTFGSIESVRWSPRGDRIAFLADGRLRVARPGHRGRALAPRLPATEPVWAPDGKRIAFVAGYDLFVVSSRGGRPRRLVRGVSSRPAWSPSGRSIAFTRSGELWRVDLVTRNEQRLLGPWSHATDPSWSPDGRGIAFEYADGGNDFHRIYTVDVEARRSRRVAARGFRPTWSPDGSLIAATTEATVFVVSAEGAHLRRVFRQRGGRERPLAVAWSPDSTRLAVAANEVFVVAVRARRPWKRVTQERPRFELADEELSWSPVGGRIAYAAEPYEPGDNDLYLATRSGDRLRAVTRNWVDEREPVWSPDGSRIAYTEYERRGSVIAVAPPGRPPTSVANGAHPAWSPDGRMIAFDRGGDLYLVTPSGEGERVVLAGPRRDSNPDWSPDGTRLVFERAPEVGLYPVELWAVGADGSGLRQITDVRRGRDRCEVTSASDPAWSPGGAEIAFALLEAGGDCITPARGGRSVYAVGADGSGDQREIVHGPSEDFQDEAYSPAWSPDGSRLVFVSDTDRRGTRIATVTASGGAFRLVTGRRSASYDPDWR